MRHNLKSHTADIPDLEFDWDPLTGELGGPHGDCVRTLVDEALSRGEITSDPWPTVYTISDPLRTPRELALVLCRFWTLDEDLARAMPSAPPSDEAAGVIH